MLKKVMCCVAAAIPARVRLLATAAATTKSRGIPGLPAVRAVTASVARKAGSHAK